MNELPMKSFGEIEDIIAPPNNSDLKSKTSDVYGTKQIVQNRRMAGTYKRVRELT